MGQFHEWVRTITVNKYCPHCQLALLAGEVLSTEVRSWIDGDVPEADRKEGTYEMLVVWA